jgi:DNA-directed RNA polymerase subunit RPC12/RpoP
MLWAAKTRPPSELELLLQSSLDRQKRQRREQVKLELPPFFNGLIDETAPTPIDAAFECRCYGTKHEVIDICRKCGRIVCALEGERPCPYCGTIILSKETRAGGEAEVRRRTEEIERNVRELGWVPEIEREQQRMAEPPVIDFGSDWFGGELVRIFEN